jgi:hypothetical protein
MLRIVLAPLGVALLLATLAGAPASADSTCDDDVSVTVTTLGSAASYPVLTRGQVLLINAQRLVVTQEPGPLATVAEAPPEPKVLEDEASRPTRPSAGAVWVSGHWAYGPTGYTWIAGRYVTARRGHVFVPPRWAESEGQHLYFNGFYVPYGVYVRSHFNKYFYSGRPKNTVATNRGPYWPVGAPTRANRPVRGSDPYWPVGARR